MKIINIKSVKKQHLGAPLFTGQVTRQSPGRDRPTLCCCNAQALCGVAPYDLSAPRSAEGGFCNHKKSNIGRDHLCAVSTALAASRRWISTQ